MTTSGMFFSQDDNSRNQNDDAPSHDVGAGHYIVKFRGETTVAFHDGSDYMPWSLIGSDEIFYDSEIEEVIRELELEA